MPSDQSQPTRQPAQQGLSSYLVIWGFAALLLALSWSVIFYKISTERETELAMVNRNNANLARVFEEHTIRTIQGVDQAILFLMNQYARLGDKIDIAGYVKDGLISDDLFIQLGIVNDKGIYSYGTQTSGIGTDVSERENIRVHFPADTGQLFIGKSTIGAVTQKWSMTFTRRINKLDGSFGGAVAVSLDPQYLTSFYRQIDLGKYGIIALVGADSTIRARRQGDEVSYGQDLTGSAVMKAAFEQGNGTTVNVARVDGVKRLYSFRKVKDYPLWIFVASGEEESLAEANFRARLYQMFGGALSLLILAFSLVISRDIARRKQTETSLADSEMQLRTIIDNEPECIKIVAADGSLTFMNPAGLKMIEADDLSQVKGHPVLGVIAPEFQAAYADLHERVIKGESAHMEYQVVGLHGGRRWLETHAVPMQSQGEVLHLAITRDIDERKKYEAELEQHYKHLEELVASRTAELSSAKDTAEAANRAKGRFLANMSHELRTPMNAIMGMTSMALRRAEDPQLVDKLTKIDNASHHLLSVINDILDISKIEAERLILERVSFKFGQVLDNLVSMVGQRAAEKGLKLFIDLSPDIARLSLLGDPLRLGQILLNLTGNAVKFTAQGAITLRIMKLEESPDDVLLRCEVQDSGIGISPEDQTRLFSSFEQGDGSMTRKYGGTGLGLVISRRLAELMGGDIGLVSTVGQGSTFWFIVRLGKANESAVPSAPTFAEESAELQLKTHYAGTRILLAEDEPINQEVSRGLLEDVGLTVELAEDGARAVAMAQRSHYDLILMDMQMPQMNGVEATRVIRELPGYAKTPILAMTANAFDEDRKVCIEAGMDDHLGKPVVPQALYETLLKWLERSTG